MKFGFVLPSGDAAAAADLAVEAERAGWDGFFAWEPTWGVDAWVMLTAAAMRTSTIKLGTMLTPLPKRKPWEVASQAATLDNLSGGRVILSVGLGAPGERFYIFEDDPGRKVRAEMLDEGLTLLSHLWRDEPFSFEGKHYRARPTSEMIPPPPVQRPRIPVWVVGLWPSKRSMRRVAGWDGWLPNVKSPQGYAERPDRERLAEGARWLREQRARQGLPADGFDVVMEGSTEPGESAVAEVREWARAGATWWLEANWSMAGDVVQQCRQRLRAGPPRG
ncbi:MAG TPA: LLM class flavin-dependent oxidoreductase [Micromonosporaceae bacterium]